ncbi:MAG: flagellar export chaperone FlgN [Lachnospiraceae bacterium]|nr:flagellar export chaperone FlgN [Lachnospiraceae bacterium]
MTDNYVLILRESLEKKVEILEHIQAENRKQKQVLEDANSDVDEFEATLDYKASLVDQIVKLDDGFETLFARVEEELQANKETYNEEIQRMQELIRQITDLSTAVQAQEKENEKLAKAKFAYVRKQVQKVRKSQKAVNNYYQSMRGDSVYQPQFMDKSK